MEEVPATQQPQTLAPAFLVPKPEGTQRMVVDYSKVNDHIAPCALQLPIIDELLYALAKCRYKSPIDLQHGSLQVQLSEAEKPLTSFILPTGEVFRYKVLSM